MVMHVATQCYVEQTQQSTAEVAWDQPRLKAQDYTLSLGDALGVGWYWASMSCDTTLP